MKDPTRFKLDQNEPNNLKDAILKSLNSGFLYFLTQNERIFSLWPRIVGDAAKSSKPYFFKDGVLYVRVPAPVYIDKFRYSLKDWLTRYRIEFGAPVVEEIRLSVGKLRNKEDQPAKIIEP
jgi:hypothetical protein